MWGNGEWGMVRSDGKVSMLLVYEEIIEIRLVGKVIGEWEGMIKEGERNEDVTVILGVMKCELELIVMIGYLSLLSG